MRFWDCFFALLTILFVGLKLTDRIDWAWYWVVAPIWIPLAVYCIVGLVFGVVIAIAMRNHR